MTNLTSSRLSGGALALAGVLLWANVGIAAESPQVRLQNVSEELLLQIRTRSEEFRRDDEALYAFVNDTLGRVLDYDQILKIILGKKVYQEASPAKRAEFAKSLKWQLIRLYAKIIFKYMDGEIRYLPFDLQSDKSYQVVRTEFLMSGKAPGRPDLPDARNRRRMVCVRDTRRRHLPD